MNSPAAGARSFEIKSAQLPLVALLLRSADPATLDQDLTERFGGKPYGWPTTAILCLAASLSGKGKLEARSDGTVLERAELAKALNK